MKIISFEGIKGGQPFEPQEFPENSLNLSNGTILQPTRNMPWFGLETGQEFKIYFDGQYVWAGGLSWSVVQLVEELNRGFWKVVS